MVRVSPFWFVLAQTDGKPLPATTAPTWDAARALAALNVQEVEFASLDGNTLGYAQGRTIAVNPVNPLPHKTRFHELALLELRAATCEARGWQATEYVDAGISGAKDRRPALDDLVKDARRRRFDVVVCWRLDRLGRNLRHLILLLDDLQATGVAFVSLSEGIDATTPAGRLQLHVLGAIAEFERARIAERVRLGMARARRDGKHLGRPRVKVTDSDLGAVAEPSVRDAASQLGVSKSFVARWRLSQRVA